MPSAQSTTGRRRFTPTHAAPDRALAGERSSRGHRWRRWGAVGALLSVVCAGSAAIEAHGGPPATGIIHSCVSNASPGGPNIGSPGSQPGGAIRIVGATAPCNPTETALDWNAQGVPGPQGPAGPQGPPGAAGSIAVVEVTAQSPSNSENEKAVTATCPAGRTPVSAGWGIFALFDQRIVITTSFRESPTSWTVIAEENDAVLDDWSLGVTAYCVVGS